MRLILACVFPILCLAVGPAHAQPADAPARRTELENVYQRWQQATDPEEKIALGERALAIEGGHSAAPLNVARPRFKAELWSGLGALYLSRAKGVRADNLEKAIGHLQSALTVWTREGDPSQWASAHNVLGIAYWSRVAGERSDNQETAISHFEAAQTVYSREVYPVQWAEAENNLAIVYWARIAGVRDENLEAAIQHFEAVLGVITRDGDPARWAAAQNNLANAYATRTQGDRDDNREQAIRHLEAALVVFTREASPNQWAQAENNLAIAYMLRARGDRAENQEKAIACLEAALTVFTREANANQWAQARHNLGSVYASRIEGDRAANRGQAIQSLKAALTVFTRDAAPLDHLRTSRLLAHVLMEAGEWTRAKPIQASAREAFLMLFSQGPSDAEARALIAEAGPLFAEAAFAAVQRGEIEHAFELANEGRARMMAVSLKLQALDLPPEERQRLDALRTAIRAEEETTGTLHGVERAAAIDRLIGLRRELLALVAGSGGKQGATGGALAEARRVAGAGGAVVVPVVTEFGGKILLVSRGHGSPSLTVVDRPALTTVRLSELLVGSGGATPTGWIGAYFVNYLQGPEQDQRWPEWLGAIDRIGLQLGSLLGNLNEVLKGRGVAHGARLVLLPSGSLGILPLGLTQDPVSKRRLGDDYEITYAPSLEALTAAQDVIAKRAPATLAAIVNPTGDLPGTQKEGALVASHFSDAARDVLEGDAATPERVLAALKGKTYWHFASHGAFSWADARQSALLMHGEPLTVGRLLDAQGLGRPRLVVLSACETGIYEITSSPDEFIGLPGTFTALGAAGVLGTLWPVSDAATALLIAKFYDLHIDAGLPPPTALSKAQAWLREASGDELDVYAARAAGTGRLASHQLADIRHALSPEAQPEGRTRALSGWTTGSNAPDPTAAPSPVAAHPFAHPYFWAGFTYNGM